MSKLKDKPNFEWKDLDFKTLERGQIIKHKDSYTRYMVQDNFGTRATAVKTVDVTHESEWVVLTIIKIPE